MLKKIIIILMIPLSLIGLYNISRWSQYRSIKKYSEGIEASREYTEDLWYYKDGGQPIFKTNPNNKVTLFFMEGFRTQSIEGMYRPWLKKLESQGVNIVIPILGLQSSPFELRNRKWFPQEDMRQALQIYEAYTANLPKDHRIVVVSQSFGTLSNSIICAKADRKPDETIYLSPLNSGLEFKAAGELVYWFSKQTAWLRYVLQ